MRPVHIGLSGWSYDHWRNGVFYPPRLPAARWLEFYAGRFDTVEVNSTFYRLPRRDAVARWLEQTPDGFLFSLKASRYLTHVKRLRDLGPGLERFLERIEPLLGSPRLGPLLWQLPRPSAATTNGSPTPSRGCHASCVTASSSGIRPGLSRRRTRCCESTGSRSRSATGPR